MRDITLAIKLFTNEHDRKRSQKCLLWIMESLVQINLTFLKTHPSSLSLYKSPVKYQAEPMGQEHWQDIPSIIEQGFGDCEDLSCWRCAELRNVGINARPYIRWRSVDGSMRYHALVMWPDGRIEDPSLALGMHGEMIRRPVFV